MIKRNILSFVILGLGIVISSVILIVSVSAQSDSLAAANIQYPVKELGNCQNQTACQAFCDKSGNMKVCLDFAEKNNLMSREEINSAKKFMSGGKGPGGCTSKNSCEEYCNDISRINECVSFAEKTGILPPQQLEEAKQIQSAIAKGVQPPPCKNKKECDVYCSEPSNMKVCVAFGEAAGFLQGKDLEEAKKMITAIDKGATPPPCKGKEACDVYCSEPEHMETCMTFAQAAGFMTAQEAQDAQKMLAAIKKGVKPPACKNKGECDVYCRQPEHLDECMNFAVAAGFMSEKDAEMAKKTGGKGPGGCVGKEQCEAFCNNPDNQQTCFNFGKENGLISQEDLQKMEEGTKRFQGSMQNLPAEVSTCLIAAVGNDAFEKMKSGQIMPSQDVGEKMKECFSKMGPPNGQSGQGQGIAPMAPGQGTGMPPISSMPRELQECVKSAIGSDVFGQLQSGLLKIEDQAGIFDKAKNCFQNFGPQQQQMSPEGMAPGSFVVPKTEPNMPQPDQIPQPGTTPGMQPISPPQDGSMPPPPAGTIPTQMPQQPYMQPAPSTEQAPMQPPPLGGFILDMLDFFIGNR